jgi:hypothetical protein
MVGVTREEAARAQVLYDPTRPCESDAGQAIAVDDLSLMSDDPYRERCNGPRI